MTAPDIRAQIADEIYTALERLGANTELPSGVGSRLDTLDDAEISLDAAGVQRDRHDAASAAVTLHFALQRPAKLR